MRKRAKLTHSPTSLRSANNDAHERVDQRVDAEVAEVPRAVHHKNLRETDEGRAVDGSNARAQRRRFQRL